MSLILGSNSPRRRELLSLITQDFEVVTCDIDERAIEEELEANGVSVLFVSEYLAKAKALAVYDKLRQEGRSDIVVIGADTSVINGSKIYGKPEDEADAVRMLRDLSGLTHVVATGVAIAYEGGVKTFTEESLVEFFKLDSYQQKKIEEYVATGDPMDKAGAYGIQGEASLLIKRIDGDYFNIVGLPVARLARELSFVLDLSGNKGKGS
ncbi:MAG: Maf family protein [Saccharofermentans sp.]|nr:Maf family protein [Saccharofermentans sp.]